MKWNFDNSKAIYSQIVEYIELLIITGVFAPGSKLASVRELALEAEVNPNTMQRALVELEQTGLLFTNRTSGRYVTDDVKLIEDLKYSFACRKISGFIQDMQSLGIDREKATEMLSNYDMGGNKND